MSETAERNKLLSELDAAFGWLPTPSGDSIVADGSADSERIRAHFAGRHWRSLSPEHLEGQAEDLFRFSPEAFRFYLPAFIRATLLDPDGTDLFESCIVSSVVDVGYSDDWEERQPILKEAARRAGTAEVVIDELFRAENTRSPRVVLARWNVLGPEQRKLILSFITFLRLYRPQEFMEGELERAERALQSSLEPVQ